jgi:hypothetical protein
MKWTVVWRPTAESRLAELWTEAADRDAVARAADQMDARLARDPQTQGESRSETTRLLIIEPLAVLFDISELDRLVAVLKVWRVEPRASSGSP